MLRTIAAHEIGLMKTHEFPMKVAGVQLTVPRNGITYSAILKDMSWGAFSGWVRLQSSLPASVGTVIAAGGRIGPHSGRSNEECTRAVLPHGPSCGTQWLEQSDET
jgi:hypothetical protein